MAELKTNGIKYIYHIKYKIKIIKKICKRLDIAKQRMERKKRYLLLQRN